MARRRGDAGGVADENGEVVQEFAMTMHNLGLNRAAEELVTMLKSGRWREWSQGGMQFRFLPGEFDYFLSQQDIRREDVIAIPDIEAKAQLEEAMDERRTGEENYRRPFTQARAELPELPARPILPYGYGRGDADAIANEVAGAPKRRQALGGTVRRFRTTGTVEPPKDERPRWQRLAASAARLPDEELERLREQIEAEHDRRRAQAKGGHSN